MSKHTVARWGRRNKVQLRRCVPHETGSAKVTQAVSNLRIRRTQKLLRDALVELIEERGFEEVTVSEIAERALVSRAAFYRNYHDKYDLVEKIFAEAMGKLLNSVGDLGQEHPTEVWVAFFEHIASYERL